jgi:hypothetical protein
MATIERPRMPEAMPVAGVGGWVVLKITSTLIALFNANREPERGDGFIRVTVVIGVLGGGYQILRIDLFTANGNPGHLHVLPTQTDPPYYLVRKPGETDVEAGLRLFEFPEFIRGFLSMAEQDGLRLMHNVSDEEWQEVGRRLEELAV